MERIDRISPATHPHVELPTVEAEIIINVTTIPYSWVFCNEFLDVSGDTA